MAELIKVGAMQLRFLRTKYDTSGALDMFEVVIPPNSRMPVPHHHRDWEETIYGLEVSSLGRSLASESRSSREMIFSSRAVLSMGSSMRRRRLRKCSCVLTPGVLGPEFFREMAVAIDGPAPPDPARMGEIMKRHGLIPAPS